MAEFAIVKWIVSRWDQIVQIFNLFANAKKVNEIAVNGVSSPEARNCPQPTCNNQRMKIEAVNGAVWWYRCEACDGVFNYPSPTRLSR